MVYAAVCGIDILFTFFLDIYLKIDERVNLVPSRILTPLEKNIQWFDEWLKSRNKIIGSLLILLFMIDLKLFFYIITNYNL